MKPTVQNLLQQGVGLDDLQSSIPAPTICDSVKQIISLQEKMLNRRGGKALEHEQDCYAAIIL